MKVSEAIKYLSEYNEDDTIAIAWWDRTIVEDMVGHKLDDDVWESVAYRINDGDWSFTNEQIVYLVDDEERNVKEVKV